MVEEDFWGNFQNCMGDFTLKFNLYRNDCNNYANNPGHGVRKISIGHIILMIDLKFIAHGCAYRMFA